MTSSRPRALAFVALLFAWDRASAESLASELRVLVVASTDRYHWPMAGRSEPLFATIARENGFATDFTRNGAALTDENLVRYDVVVHLHLAPFDLSTEQQDALQRFILRGGGWVGVHAAGLTGRQFVGKDVRYWQWFEDFFGGVVYSPHPKLQKGTVIVEDRTHPVTRNLPARFEVVDEWYEFDKSPRPAVHVLATADESTYRQNKPMGDHPIIWTNPKFDRMVYVGIGHDVSMNTDPNFTILLRDAILWARPPKVALAEGPQPAAAWRGTVVVGGMIHEPGGYHPYKATVTLRLRESERIAVPGGSRVILTSDGSLNEVETSVHQESGLLLCSGTGTETLTGRMGYLETRTGKTTYHLAIPRAFGAFACGRNHAIKRDRVVVIGRGDPEAAEIETADSVVRVLEDGAMNGSFRSSRTREPVRYEYGVTWSLTRSTED
jgi:type 1 glutamine amidotransferase